MPDDAFINKLYDCDEYKKIDKLRNKIVELETEGMTEVEKIVYFVNVEIMGRLCLDGKITVKEIMDIIEKHIARSK